MHWTKRTRNLRLQLHLQFGKQLHDEYANAFSGRKMGTEMLMSKEMDRALLLFAIDVDRKLQRLTNKEEGLLHANGKLCRHKA